MIPNVTVIKPFAIRSFLRGDYATTFSRSSGNYLLDQTRISTIYKFPAIPNNPTKKVTVGVISLGGGLFGKLNSTTKVLTEGDVQEHWIGNGIGTKLGSGIPVDGISTGVTYTGQPVVKILGTGINAPSTGDGYSTLNNTIVVETIGTIYPSPNLTIVLYIGTNTLDSLRDLINAAANDNTNNPSVLCIPWGAPESSFTLSTITTETNTTTISGALKAANAKGITICTASGINGSSDIPDSKTTSPNAVDFPSSSPYCTSVGGSSLSYSTIIDGYHEGESPWNISGGGVSKAFLRPSYQFSKIGGTSTSMRSIPDISFNADPWTTGKYYFYPGVANANAFDGYVICGGTSISAAIATAFFALCVVNNKTFPVTNSANKKLYSATPDCFNKYGGIINPTSDTHVDLNTAVFTPSKTYDNCTGLGSIIGTKLISKL